MKLNVNGKRYNTDIDIIENDQILVRFYDAANPVINKTIAAEWLNMKSGLMERIDSNGPQSCNQKLYEAFLDAADEKIMDIGSSLGHTYTMNSQRVTLMDEVDPELIKEIVNAFQDNPVDELYTNNVKAGEYMDTAEGAERSSLTEKLALSYNLLKDPETYLFMSNDMGWRQLSGYKLVEIENGDDIIDALHGDYDYTATITKNKNLPYFEATVSSQDSPLKESYKIIPASYLKDIFEEDLGSKAAILHMMREDEDVAKFVKAAIPEMARDDIVAGILTIVAQTRGEKFNFLEDLKENRGEQYKDALAYGLVHADYEQIYKNLVPVVDFFDNRIDVAFSIENTKNPLSEYPWKSNEEREAYMKKDPAVKALHHMLEKAIYPKIKKTINALFSTQRKNELKRLEKMGKNLDAAR